MQWRSLGRSVAGWEGGGVIGSAVAPLFTQHHRGETRGFAATHLFFR